MEVVIPYKPRDAFKKFHDSGKRWSVLVCHRRAGKSVAAINHLIRDAIRYPKSNFAFVAPTYKQGKRVIWQYLKDFTLPIPHRGVNEAELKVTFSNGSNIYVLGAENPDSLRGMSLKGVVLDEYSQQPPHIFGEIISPALADKEGYCIWSGTIKGKNHLWQLWNDHKDDPSWHTLYLRASESGIIPQKELDEQKKIKSESEYAQEFELEPSAVLKGAIFGSEMQWLNKNGRITTIPFEEFSAVDTYWDLGIGDYTVVVFMQSIGLERRVIDCLSVHGTSLAEITKTLRNKGYRYGTHYLPHDAKARELQTGKTREEFLRETLTGLIQTIPRPRTKENSIEAFRLQSKKLWINKDLVQLVNALEQYEQEWDEAKGVFLPIPLHNWCSHYADAMQVWALSERMLFTPNYANSTMDEVYQAKDPDGIAW